MMTKEEYNRELIRMWDSLRTINKGKSSCDGVLCGDCQLSLFDGCSSAEDIFDIYKTVEKWSKEHPQKKYKVSKLEYDIMRAAIDYSFEEEAFKDVDILYELLINGYFPGATRDMTINYYFDNCEVEENDG